MGVTDSIDRFFNGIDNLVDAGDRVVNRHKRTEQKVAQAGGKAQAPAPVQNMDTKALVRARYRLTEAIDNETGRQVFIVIGGSDRAEFNSRELAETVLIALNAKAQR